MPHVQWCICWLCDSHDLMLPLLPLLLLLPPPLLLLLLLLLLLRVTVPCIAFPL